MIVAVDRDSKHSRNSVEIVTKSCYTIIRLDTNIGKDKLSRQDGHVTLIFSWISASVRAESEKSAREGTTNDVIPS